MKKINFRLRWRMFCKKLGLSPTELLDIRLVKSPVVMRTVAWALKKRSSWLITEEKLLKRRVSRLAAWRRSVSPAKLSQIVFYFEVLSFINFRPDLGRSKKSMSDGRHSRLSQRRRFGHNFWSKRPCFAIRRRIEGRGRIRQGNRYRWNRVSFLFHAINCTSIDEKIRVDFDESKAAFTSLDQHLHPGNALGKFPDCQKLLAGIFGQQRYRSGSVPRSIAENSWRRGGDWGSYSYSALKCSKFYDIYSIYLSW